MSKRKQILIKILKNGKLATKDDIADLYRIQILMEKVRKINSKNTSKKTRHVEANKELNDRITSYIKLMDGLKEEVKPYQQKD